MLKIKIALLICCYIFIHTISFGQNNSLNGSTIYLVRHAEKDTGNDPALSKAGNERAGDLYRQLEHKNIKKIYFTQYRRTRLTADSLQQYQRIDTGSYKADATGDDLLLRLIADSTKPNNILVVGHSNTIPAIIKKLGVKDFDAKDIPDNEYDNLFIVTIQNDQASLKKLKYGKLSEAAKPATMKPLQ